MRRWFLLLAVAVLLAAAGLRLFALESLPPGPHYDEAAAMLMARSIAFGGADLFPFIPSYSGHEALYSYLAAGMMRLIGERELAMRLTSAFSSIVMTAASMSLGRAMFRGNRGAVIGLMVGLLAALSFHQMWLGRQMFRAVLQPAMQALMFVFLWRGLPLKKGNWRWLIAAGIFGGLVNYTYLASRIVPFWLAAGGLALLTLDRKHFLARLRQGMLFFGTIVLVSLPMAIFALQNPEMFFNRLNEVTQSGAVITLPESILLHLKMFFIQGDPYLRYNIPDRPYLTWPEGIFLLIGVALAARRLFREKRVEVKVAYFMMLLSPLMVLPSMIALGGLPPSHMRSVAMIPMLFVLAAVGFEALYSAFWQKFFGRSKQTELTFAAGLAAVLILGTAALWQSYSAWARRIDLYYETDSDLVAASNWLKINRRENELVYVASRYREHPTILALYGDDVTWLGRTSLFLPPEGQSGLAIFAHFDPPPADWAAWLVPFAIDDVPAGPDGGAAFRAYRLSAEYPLSENLISPQTHVENPYLALLGVDARPTQAGENAEIVTAWKIQAPPPFYALTPVLLLEDEIGTQLARADVYLIETDRWRPGESYLQRIDLPIPPGTPPGNYRLKLLWVDRDSETYVSYRTSDGKQGGIKAEIGQIEVLRPENFPAPDSLSIDFRQHIDAAPGVRLLGWNAYAAEYRPGEWISTRLFWQAVPTENQRQALRFSVILRGQPGEQIIAEGEAINGAQNWIDGEVLIQPVRWQTPLKMPAGEYSLLLRIDQEEILLGALALRGVPRLFDPPEMDRLVDIRFDDVITLYGYTLKISDKLHVEIVWRADNMIHEDVTVFLHLVDETGNNVAQRDVFPQDNSYPTSLWTAGEYVVDRHIFDVEAIPPGTYTLRLGLYQAADGVRWQIGGEGDENGDYVEIGPFDLVPVQDSN